MPEEETVSNVWVGEEIPLSNDAEERLMGAYGPGIAFSFHGSVRLSNRSYAIWLCREAEDVRMLLYNIGSRFPTEVRLCEGVAIVLRGLTEQGNCLEVLGAHDNDGEEEDVDVY